MAGEPVTAINAVAPPGGWSVLVICIITTDKATATAEASQIVSGKTFAAVTPTKAEMTCPPIRFRGCAKGLWMTP